MSEYEKLMDYIEWLSKKLPAASEYWDSLRESIDAARHRAELCDYEGMLHELTTAAWSALDGFRVARRPIMSTETTEFFDKLYDFEKMLAQELRKTCGCR
jgi:hypothetical protein